MAATTTKLQDLAYKVRYFSTLHDVMDRASRQDKVRGATELITTLSPSKANWIHDKFTSALDQYRADLHEPLSDFLKCYNEFKSWADIERKSSRVNVTREEVEAVLSLVDKTIAELSKYDDIPTHKRIPNDSSSDDNRRSRGDETIRLGRIVKKKLADVERRVGDRLDKDKRLNVDQIRAEIRKLNAKIAALDSSITQETQNEPVSMFTSSLPSLSSVLQESINMLESASSTEMFDSNKTSPDDFLKYQESKPTWLPQNAQMQRINPFDQLVTLNTMYDRLGQPMLGAIDEGGKVVAALQKSAMLDTKDDTRKRNLQTVMDMLTDLSAQLLLAPLSGKKAKQLDEFVLAVNTMSSILQSGDKVTLKQKQGASSSSGYSNNKTPGDSGSSPSSSDGPGSSAAGFMYRRLDKQRLKAYVTQLESFKKAVDSERLLDHLSNLSERLTARMTELEAQLDAALKDSDPTRSDYLKRTLSDAKMLAMTGFCRSARRTIGGYVAMHVGFLVKKHRDAIDYINYWHAMADAGIMTDEDAMKDIKLYQDTRKEIVVTAKAKLMDEATTKVRAALDTSAGSKATNAHIGLNEKQATEVDEAFTRLLVWIGDQADRVADLYARGAPTLLESLLDMQFITIYALKLLRLMGAWLALRIAGRVFQGMYDERVYSRDEQPPQPITFVGMFVGIDVALNLVLATVLVFAKYLFKTVDNQFPVDGHLLSLWAFDYVVSTVVVAVIAIIIGQIIRRKKYFRYKYEGDRGIRAMQQMVMYVYCIMLFVPFFRLANG